MKTTFQHSTETLFGFMLCHGHDTLSVMSWRWRVVHIVYPRGHSSVSFLPPRRSHWGSWPGSNPDMDALVGRGTDMNAQDFYFWSMHWNFSSLFLTRNREENKCHIFICQQILRRCHCLSPEILNVGLKVSGVCLVCLHLLYLEPVI